MPSSSCILVWLLVWIAAQKGLRGDDGRVSSVVVGLLNQVDMIVSQVVEQHLAGCHLVLATTSDHSTMFPLILRRLAAEDQASVVVELGSLFSQDQPTQDHLLQGLWGDARTNCRAFILYTDQNSSLLSRFLESSKLWLEPEVHVVVIGGTATVRAITRHTSLRNTIHMLCLTVDNLKHLISPVHIWFRKGTLEEVGGKDMKVFRRCLYCNNGEMGIQQLLQQSNQSYPFQWDDIAIPETLQNFMGHTFEVVALHYFPFIVYDQSNTDGDSLLSPRDSLDVRILNTISAHLNFTYEMHEPWDGTWGVPMTGGNWSGVVGTLQHHKADFSLNLTPSPSRMKVISHSRIYSYDPLLIVSLKPGPLPRRLALLRPFPGNLWMIIIIFTFVAGVILWLLQRTWSWLSGYPGIRLDLALFYSWGVLLQEPVSYSSASISDQVFVGWWLLSCLIISTAYRSSLVAHLSVQSKYLPINTFQDLLNQEGWSWGGFPLRGTSFLFFNQTTDAVIQEIYKNLQIYEVEDGMDQVMAGGFSYIAHEKRIRNHILPHYQDKYGNSLLHLSTTEYPVLGGNSWGMRQGAPFTRQIRMMKQRLIEAGLIDHWMDDVIQIRAEHITQRRSKAFEDKHSETEDGQVVLGLDHLQGAFYLLLLGYIVASITFLREKLVPRYTGVHQSHIMG